MASDQWKLCNVTRQEGQYVMAGNRRIHRERRWNAYVVDVFYAKMKVTEKVL